MYLSSDCTLQLECMKLELLVIAIYNLAVNISLEIVQTACQYNKVLLTGAIRYKS